ncbi:MAG: hypothetical protein ACYCY6_01355 [Minisyncoccota bacterium]
MFKLLTIKETDKVRREYRFRRVDVMLGLMSILLLVAILACSPSYIFSKGKRDAALYTLETLNASGHPASKLELEKWVEYTNNEIEELALDPVIGKPSDYFKKVLESKPATSKVTGFLWTRGAGNFKSIRVRGEASTRQSLLQFQDNLRSTGDWTQVDFPVSAIAEESDINFELSLIPTPIKQ